jgi:sodium-dependent phosphate cotransporter
MNTQPQDPTTLSDRLLLLGRLAVFAWLFFLSIEALGSGMKASFKHAVEAYLAAHGASFTELVSFVVGVIGTSLVQSSSTVTSMAVVLTQEGILPLLIAVGIVHGANLGTSVTSSIVAFFSEMPPLTGNPLVDLRTLLFTPRQASFRRAVSTAVVHGLFNALLVTSILLVLELPFGIIRNAASASASAVAGSLAGIGWIEQLLAYTSPKTYTAPLVDAVLGTGLPGWALVILSFGLLFASLRGFAGTMTAALTQGETDPNPRALGEKLLGRRPLDTFLRGLFLTILVQSSSATTSMVVPLAALGFFSLRQVFPFIMGANIGTTTTALIVAATALGQPGFQEGMTIALCHFYLNVLAVLLVVVVPGLQHSVLGSAEWLAHAAERAPVALLAYLGALAVVMPLVVLLLPTQLASVALGAMVVFVLVAPHLSRVRPGGDFDGLATEA